MMHTLTEEQLVRIEKAGLEILERTGMLVPHGQAREILSQKMGVEVDGEVVRLSPEVVKEQTKGIRACEGYDSHTIAGAYSHNYLDADTGEMRQPTCDDLIRSIRQADALDLGVCAPVVPLDIEGPKQELVMERLTHENAKFSYGAGQATNPVTAEASLEMFEVLGRKQYLELWITSPLNLEGNSLEVLWSLRHRRPRVRVVNMPVQGMSGPIFPGALLAQSTAECLGAAAIVRLLDIAEEVSYRLASFYAYSVDMRSGNVLLSGPDYLKLMVATSQLAKRYGIETPSAKSLLTSSKQPDIQAAAEKSAQGIVAAMAGVTDDGYLRRQRQWRGRMYITRLVRCRRWRYFHLFKW